MNSVEHAIERSQRDVPQLVLKQVKLCTALIQAWRNEDYVQVVALVQSLAYLVGRLPDYEESERILLLGIQASRHLQDWRQQALFLNRLAGLRFSHGKFDEAWAVWQESIEIARGQGYAAFLWEPLCSVAHITDIICAYDSKHQFAETLLHAERVDTPQSKLVALFIRGFHARNSGDRDKAYKNLHACLNLMCQESELTQGSCSYHYLENNDSYSFPASSYIDFFRLEVETELARTQGEYGRARGYGEAALALAFTYCDPYTVTALLFDQALFAYQQGMFDDAYLFAQQLLSGTGMFAIPYHVRSGNHLLHLLANRLPAPHIVLSKREQAVLQLVADGLSNAEIATQLVITVGTVKKHMEHIYLKLNARSRTHAIAQARALQLLS
jgi:DNA-binding CsgD family transcriptional regulator